MPTPFSKERYNIADFREAVSSIKSDIETIQPLIDNQAILNDLAGINSDIETVQPLIDKADLSSSMDVEAQMLIALSGLELKMTSFTTNRKADIEAQTVTTIGDLVTKMTNFAQELRRKLA